MEEDDDDFLMSGNNRNEGFSINNTNLTREKQDCQILSNYVINPKDHLFLLDFFENNVININCTYEFGETPLHKAAKVMNNYDNIKTLLDYGADANLEDENGYYPLDIAIINVNDLDTIKLLVNNTENINHGDNQEKYILELAMMLEIDNEIKNPIIEYLIEQGANINILSESSMKVFGKKYNKVNILELAVMCYCDIDILNLLIKKIREKGLDLEKLTENILDICVYFCELEFFQYFLKIKDINYISAEYLDLINTYYPDCSTIYYYIVNNLIKLDGETMLDYVSYDFFDIVKIMIKKGVDQNYIDEDGNNLLSYVIRTQVLDMLNYLLENKIDLNNKIDNQFTTLEYAVLHGSYEIFKTLEEIITDYDVMKIFIFSLESTNKDIINYIIEKNNIDVNNSLNDIITTAVSYQREEEEKILFKYIINGLIKIKTDFKYLSKENLKIIKPYITDEQYKIISSQIYPRLTKTGKSIKKTISNRKAKEREKTDWQVYCAEIGNQTNLEELIEISQSIGLPTQNLSKRELCKQLSISLESNQAFKNFYIHPNCRNDDDLSPVFNENLNELHPDCIVDTKEITNNCYYIGEFYNENGEENVDMFTSNPMNRQQWREGFIEEIRNKRQSCNRVNNIKEIHTMKPRLKQGQLGLIKAALEYTGTRYTNDILEFEREELNYMLKIFQEQVVNYTPEQLNKINRQRTNLSFLGRFISFTQDNIKEKYKIGVSANLILGNFLDQYMEKFY